MDRMGLNNKNLSLLFLLLGWFLIGWIGRGLADDLYLDREAALFSQVVRSLGERSYTNALTPREMTYAAIRALLVESGDPYAQFLDPTLLARKHDELRGDGSAVIGIRGEMRSGQFVVTSVAPGGPADLAGVRRGDVLLEIDGWRVGPNARGEEVALMVRGKGGSVARLALLRQDERIELEVVREALPEVQAAMLEGQVAYLRFDHVGTETASALKAELERLLAQNPKGVILDLRYNGGGWMNATREILDLFLGEGVAFTIRDRQGRGYVYCTADGDLAESIPLALLIGPNTYSASETIAAAVQDYGRGLLVGETTHGKGSIKETTFLRDGSAIDITVARWLSPVTQQDYEGRGVPPDIFVPASALEEDDPVLNRAIEALTR